MRITLFYILISVFVSVEAQNSYVVKIPEVDTLFSTKLIGDFFIEKKQIIGNQYINSNWSLGNILLSSGDTIYGKLLKYNGLLDELMWLNSLNYGVIKIDKQYIAEFWFKNQEGANQRFKKIFLNNSNIDSTQTVFTEIMIEGALSLYIHRKIEKQFPRYIMVNNIRQKFDVLEPSPVYYILQNSKKYIQFQKINRKSFLKFFPEKQKIISKYIKDYKLNIRNESDLVKLISLLNKDNHFS